MELGALKPGMTGRAELLVGEEHTAPRVGSGRVHVLATPVMINLMEAAALDACENLITAGHQSLGTRLDVRHSAARFGRRPHAGIPSRSARREGPDRRRHAPAPCGQCRALRSARAGEA